MFIAGGMLIDPASPKATIEALASRVYDIMLQGMEGG